ncbi:MAG: carboxypeptidase regulatory-like domain-containing protein [Gemmatimonadaceae bacterium]|nr:carboxypeptidase regulatory-like domain-containing protein [Gemmatimonadaceae bacterium]
MTGVVREQSGRPLRGAVVTAQDTTRSARSDAQGRFRLSHPPGEPVVLTVTADAFRTEVIRVTPLASAEERQVSIVLVPLYRLAAATVVASRERPLLNAETATTGGALERAELTALPTDARDPIALVYNVPGITQSTGFFGDAPALSVNAQNGLYTSYLLDDLDNTEGFLGGPRVEFPLAGLARIDAFVNGVSAKYGRSPSGVVLQQSLAGGNDTRGEWFVYGRPGTALGLDGDIRPAPGADPAAVRRRQEGYRRYQIGGAQRGALRQNRTFYAVAAEYTDENEDRIASTALATFLGTERRQKTKLFARLDHSWSPTQFTTWRAAFSATQRAGNGSGIVTPDADNITQREGGLYAITHRSVLSGGRASNTFAAQLGTYRWNFPPRTGAVAPQVTIVGPGPAFVPQAVVGSTNFVFDEREVQWQLRDVFERAVGSRHTMRVGADLIHSRFRLFAAGTNPLGSYVVVNTGNITPSAGRQVSLGDIPASVQVLSYTVDARPQRVNQSQTLLGLFAEDVWRPTPTLTVTSSLRWDYDDITSRGASSADLSAIQPRLSATWATSPVTVWRGSLGLYAGRFPYATLSDAQQLGPNGNATVTFSGASAPAFGQGPSAAALATAAGQLPPREVFAEFTQGLRLPRSRQATIGWQRQVGSACGLSADLVWVRTTDLPWLLDLNPVGRRLTAADTANRVCASATSCPADVDRPVAPTVSGARRLSTAASGGRADYTALYLAARRSLGSEWVVDANYVWSRARTDAEDINFSATQGNCFRTDRIDVVTGQACNSDEWGPANNDRTHRVTLRAVWSPAEALRFSLVQDAQSGQPFNRVAGVTVGGGQSRYDLLGVGPIRGNGFVGNNDRYLGVARNGERLPAYWNTNLSAAWLPAFAGRRLEVRADVFNVLDVTTWGGFVTGTGGNGNIVQTGRPGDPIVNFTPGPPRQVQLSATWSF